LTRKKLILVSEDNTANDLTAQLSTLSRRAICYVRTKRNKSPWLAMPRLLHSFAKHIIFKSISY